MATRGISVEVQPLGPDLAVPRFRSGEFEATMSGSPRNMEPSLRVIALSSPYKLMPEIHLDELWIEENWERTQTGGAGPQ